MSGSYNTCDSEAQRIENDREEAEAIRRISERRFEEKRQLIDAALKKEKRDK